MGYLQLLVHLSSGCVKRSGLRVRWKGPHVYTSLTGDKKDEGCIRLSGRQTRATYSQWRLEQLRIRPSARSGNLTERALPYRTTCLNEGGRWPLLLLQSPCVRSFSSSSSF